MEPAADAVQRRAGAVQAAADAVQCAAGAVQAAADAVQRGAGAVQAAADAVQRGAGAVQPAADAVQRGAGAVQPAADAVQRGAGAVQRRAPSECAEHAIARRAPWRAIGSPRHRATSARRASGAGLVNEPYLVPAMLALAIGTYALRWTGPALRHRLRLSARMARLLDTGALILLAALVATSTLPTGSGELGIALPAGVAVGGTLAWRRAPLLVTVLAAAATTALLRLLGVH
ncbi:AzlD domain-containing protein [Nocardia halotolerans]|uniref:AzlD domain-containing protein n=1 Tax=Nocardia halotolerans TaxID=1755878 RepID=A0ABV8VNS9_9NOCA